MNILNKISIYEKELYNINNNINSYINNTIIYHEPILLKIIEIKEIQYYTNLEFEKHIIRLYNIFNNYISYSYKIYQYKTKSIYKQIELLISILNNTYNELINLL